MNTHHITSFLKANVVPIGFGNYTLSVIEHRDELETCIAETVFSEMNGILEVNLYKTFFELSDEEQKSALLHELVHARYGVMEQRLETEKRKQEEMFINDTIKLMMKR